MRRRLNGFFVVSLVALGAAALGGCRTMKETSAAIFYSGDLITYEQYLSIDPSANPKPSVDDVINTLGKPNDTHDRDGARVRLDYMCMSLNDELKRAEFHFNKDERLMKKELW